MTALIENIRSFDSPLIATQHRPTEMLLHNLIAPNRISLTIGAGSKKRLLEKVSALLSDAMPNLDNRAAFQSLTDRERLGSTGIGNGVALPHGRLKGLTQAVGACVILDEEMDFDSIDGKPVKIIFVLLVPEEATEEHLQILAQLARIFAAEENRKQLLKANSSNEIYDFFCSFDADYQQAS